MLETILKVGATAILVVAAAEAAKRSTVLGAVLASLPLTSLLAMIWLWADTRDAEKIAALSTGIFWLVLPSLALFLAMPFLLRRGISFPVSLGASVALTVVCYFAMIALLKRLGIGI